MDTWSTNRPGRRINHMNASSEYHPHPVDNNNQQKTHRYQNNSKNDSFRIAQSYRSLRGRKTIVGFSIFVLAYIYLFILLVRNIGNEETANTAKWSSTSTLVGRIGKEQSKTKMKTKTNGRDQLTKLRPIDYEMYTIRMNTWRRPKQLVQSVKHHASCPGVQEIQVVWCDTENEPPGELLAMAAEGSLADTSATRAVITIERHDVNSLNERFHILEPAPTLGILSIDDDVLRPCEAIDSGFFKWTKSPHRMIGFDARTHVENDDGSWQYGYLSTTKNENKYSLSLTRYCFVHRDYMDRYTRELPSSILDTVATKFNCEDIAMSLMISSLTQGRPPLLADLWAMNSQLKLDVDAAISGGGSHKKFRDECLDSFASIFGLKNNRGDNNNHNDNNRLQKAKWVHTSQNSRYFECGDKEDDNANGISYTKSKREIDLERKVATLRRSGENELRKYLAVLTYEAGKEAWANGLLSKQFKHLK